MERKSANKQKRREDQLLDLDMETPPKMRKTMNVCDSSPSGTKVEDSPMASEKSSSPSSEESSEDSSEETSVSEDLSEDPSDTESLSEVLGNPVMENRIEREQYLKKLENVDPDLFQSLRDVYSYLDNSHPNITHMMKTPMRLEDKAELYELYEHFSLLEALSADWIETKKLINSKFRNSVKEYQTECLLEETSRNYLKNMKTILENNFNSSFTLENKILSLNCSDRTKNIIFLEYKRFKDVKDNDDEKIKLDSWLNKVVQLPFNNITRLFLEDKEKFLFDCKERLDSKLYGLQAVKEQILIFLNAKIQNPNVKESTLGLIGEPGVGKTKIATLVSECLGLPFAQINCGGLSDTRSIKGFPYTYVGSKPGEITTAVTRIGCKNGVLFLDEFEKVTSRISDTLLHIIDPNQNSNFTDDYFGSDILVDLSEIWFILSMNKEPADMALRDRIFFIKLPKYTRDEKVKIIKYYSIPRICKDIGLTDSEFSEELCKYIVDVFSDDEAGMRKLDHILKDIIRKIFFQKTNPNIKTTFKIKDTKVITKESVNILYSQQKKEHLSMFL